MPSLGLEVEFVYHGGGRGAVRSEVTRGVYIGGQGEEVPPNVTRVIVDSNVTSIGKGAFERCSSLASIKIPSSITTISHSAFQRCSSLTSIEIPSSITTIDAFAFYGCSSLTSIEFQIPSSVTTIGRLAFYGCSSLTSIEISPSVTTIGEGAFSGCSSLTAIEISSSVTSIGEYAFAGCSSLLAAVRQDEIYQPGQEYVTDWLKVRFDGLPLHRICYKGDVTKDKILECFTDYPEAVRRVDKAKLTALHVLMINPRVTFEMVEVLLQKYPEATTETDINGWNALHHACYNPHIKVKIVNRFLRDSPISETLLLSATDGSNDPPCAVAIRHKHSEEIQLALFELYPINKAQLNSTKADDQKQLVDLTIKYLDQIFNAPAKLLNLARQHGWVHLVGELSEGEAVDKCVRFIKEAPIGTLEYLAYCKDNQNRSAMDNATREIRAAMEERIFFMGRYEFVKGPAIHKSATSVVLKAFDKLALDEYGVQFDKVLKEQPNASDDACIDKECLRKVLKGLGFGAVDARFESFFVLWDTNKDRRISREEFVGICKTVVSDDHQGAVVLKFMKNKEQFQREVDSRKNHTLDHNFVVHITEAYSSEDPGSSFAAALESNKCAATPKSDIHAHVEDLSDYKYAIAMPCADRNLDTIFRSERPSDIRIRGIAKEIADAIAHLHRNEMIHGDVKLLNAVRVGTCLRLIDLDASVKIGEASYVGAKFSSGMLPPEMIAKLTVEEYEKYMAYFKTNVSAASRGKIQPKGVPGSNTIFAVKTFLTKESKKQQFDKDGKPGWIICQEPFEKNDLPYDLVEATRAIDIWSFGVVLYELYTGATLFAVDRDDNLKDGASMKELYEWNDEKKMSKLENVHDLSAYRLLNNLLSTDPLKRHDTMDKVLQDGYFSTIGAAEVLETVLLKVTKNMEINTERVLNRINSSTSVTCNAIFEATEVSTPACFIILPEELPEEIDLDSKSGDDGHWGDRFEYIQGVLDEASSCITAPLDFALDSIKEQFIENHMFLYLVDEYTGRPVVTKGGAYPIQINVRSEKAKKFLPVMAIGLQAVAVANTAAGLIAMFYPVVPQMLIPTELIEMANNFINNSKPGVIKQALNDTSGAREAVRGNALREFGAFLKANDANSTFSGMKRLCDTSSGRAIWVTEESAQKIALENDSSTTEIDELKQLKAENKRLAITTAEEIQKLKTENESLENEKKQLVEEKIQWQQQRREARKLKAERLEEIQKLETESERLEEDSDDCFCCVLM
jgi:serine/threonine protein kinase